MPSDSYGSAISAGFTMVMAVAELVESLRENISVNLYLAADSVTEHQKGFKVMVKGKIYVKEIDEALKDLEEASNNFQEEAHICSEQRLGRLEDHILSVRRSLARLEGNQQETSRIYSLEARAWRTSKNGEIRGHPSTEI
ncbi:hypothetical protein FJTKL_14584 [Diaporthe vaccinii]|uniref:Uncharacterized protein n=1 Tax=Diaporthe vaccinii TaxID=105482 RepID=A0ABR4E7B6_9PEZI